MAIEGELVVRLATTGGRVTRAEARAERPRLAAPLFEGRPADRAPALAGTLFAICGRSQAIASAAAVASAQGRAVDASVAAARDLRIAAETLQEHAWRFLVDWPRLAGLDPDVAALASARRLLAPLLAAEPGVDAAASCATVRDWAGQAILGEAPAEFLARADAAALWDWVAAGRTSVAALAGRLLDDDGAAGTSPVGFLPHGDDDWVGRDLAAAIASDPGFDGTPHWQGGPRETGALARLAGHGLVADVLAQWGRSPGARLVARLVEVAQVAESLPRGGGRRHGAASAGAGAGIGWVETARGLLVHRVAVAGERVAHYRIVAPTEWNFHPAGAFARGAAGLAAADPATLERRARWLVASLDPCVAVRFEAAHA